MGELIDIRQGDIIYVMRQATDGLILAANSKDRQAIHNAVKNLHKVFKNTQFNLEWEYTIIAMNTVNAVLEELDEGYSISILQDIRDTIQDLEDLITSMIEHDKAYIEYEKQKQGVNK